MILELIGALVGLRALWEVGTYEADVGVKCRLCGWSYHHGPHPTAEQRAEAERVAELHALDAHPAAVAEAKRRLGQ